MDHLFHDMDEDFPPDVDQVLFPMVSGAIYLKCVKANKDVAPLGHDLPISHKCHKQLQRTALYYNF